MTSELRERLIVWTFRIGFALVVILSLFIVFVRS
jgi:hypothetical protein